MDENAAPPAEVPPAPPVQGQYQGQSPKPEVQSPAPPPATAPVVHGAVKSEREIELETRLRGVDRVAELPRGSFIGYNRESGAELSGKLF